MSRAAGLALGFAADRLFGDPARLHPVAGFGNAASRLETRMYADSRGRGAAYALVLVGSTTTLGVLVERATRHRPLTHTLATAMATWAVLGGTSLGGEASTVQRQLAGGDLAAARVQLTHLVGRDTRDLRADEIARATVESLAENTSDAVVAPLLLGGLGGIGGLVGYRAANTLDAMVGHLSVRYSHFGWASARLDDLLNLAGARLTALLSAALAVTVGGSATEAVDTWRRDARHHPSPNAGPVEASFAGALGVTLGGVNTYGDRVEDRHTLGDGPSPTSVDIERASALAARVGVAALLVSVLISALTDRRPRRQRQRHR